MAPTDAELIFFGIILVAVGLSWLWCKITNPAFDPNGEDPYRYCPKEEY